MKQGFLLLGKKHKNQGDLMLDYLGVLKSKNIKDLESFLDKNPSFINSQSQSYHITTVRFHHLQDE